MAYQFNPTMGGVPFGGIMGGQQQPSPAPSQGIMPQKPTYQAPERGDPRVSPLAMALIQAGSNMQVGQPAGSGILSGYLSAQQMADEAHRRKIEDARWDYERQMDTYRDSRDYGFERDKFGHTKNVDTRQLDQGDQRLDLTRRGQDIDQSQHGDMMGYRNRSLDQDRAQFEAAHGLDRDKFGHTQQMDRAANTRANERHPYEMQGIMADIQNTDARTGQLTQQTTQADKMFPYELETARNQAQAAGRTTVAPQNTLVGPDGKPIFQGDYTDRYYGDRAAQRAASGSGSIPGVDGRDIMQGWQVVADKVGAVDGEGNVDPDFLDKLPADRRNAAEQAFADELQRTKNVSRASQAMMRELGIQPGQTTFTTDDNGAWPFGSPAIDGLAPRRNPSAQSGVNPQGRGQSQDIPPRPSNVPPGSAYSPSRGMWRSPDGQLFDRSGNPAG